MNIKKKLAAAFLRLLGKGHSLAKLVKLLLWVWDSLSTREQARVLQLLIERVEYDGRSGDVAITFHPAGIKTLSAEVLEETAA